MMRVNSPGPVLAWGAAGDGGRTGGATGPAAIGGAGDAGGLEGIEAAGMEGAASGTEAGSADNAFSSCVNPPAEGAAAGGAGEA